MHPAAHSGSAVEREVEADMEAVATAAVEATQPPEARPGRTGGTAGLVEGSAAEAASNSSNTSPGHRMAAVIMVRANTEGTARAGRDIITGRTAAAAVAADMGADTPPATGAERAEGAAEATGTERHARRFVVEQMAITLCRHY